MSATEAWRSVLQQLQDLRHLGVQHQQMQQQQQAEAVAAELAAAREGIHESLAHIQEAASPSDAERMRVVTELKVTAQHMHITVVRPFPLCSLAPPGTHAWHGWVCRQAHTYQKRMSATCMIVNMSPSPGRGLLRLHTSNLCLRSHYTHTALCPTKFAPADSAAQSTRQALRSTHRPVTCLTLRFLCSCPDAPGHCRCRTMRALPVQPH